MLAPEQRDKLAFSVKWFGCGTCTLGAALVHVTNCTIQIKCGSVQKLFVVAIRRVIFLQYLQFGQPVQYKIMYRYYLNALTL